MQHLESTQLPEEHAVPSVQANPSAVLVLQTVSPGELAGVAPAQAWQASFAVFGMLLGAQLTHTSPEAATLPAVQPTHCVKGLTELLPAAQLAHSPPMPADVLPEAQSTHDVKGLSEVLPAAQSRQMTAGA